LIVDLSLQSSESIAHRRVNPMNNEVLDLQVNNVICEGFGRCNKSERKILKKTKPQQTEIAAGASDSVCSGCTVDTDHHQGDDLNR
jgi:hypothetical protein